ncbi:MAG TPA: hypothetical protein PLY31_04885 [Tenuifilaceae bacterium]|nr:hypothetical protein [Tenuifilaceae bacterium]
MAYLVRCTSKTKTKSRRKLKLDDKIQILRKGATHGVEVSCFKHQTASSLFNGLKSNFSPVIPRFTSISSPSDVPLG